jgi:hypothetical protein
MEMDCKQAVAGIVEAARKGAAMKGALQMHAASCTSCAGRWEAECELASHLRRMRAMASRRRSSPASRNDLMRQFSARHWRLVHPAWGIGLAAAAGLLIVLATLKGPFLFTKPHHSPPVMGVWLSSNSLSFEPSADVYSAQDEEEYVQVPYLPPPVPGERLSVMHAELYPSALTTLGVSIDLATIAANGNGTVHADVVVGEDGLPRAVRLDRGDRPDEADF